MDALRSFTAGNRANIMNVIYVVACLVALYYLYKFLVAGSYNDINVLDHEIDANKSTTFKLPTHTRIKTGGEYTISYWMYINSWNHGSGLAKGVLEIRDSSNTTHTLLTTALYPNEPKLMIRIHTENAAADSLNKITNFTSAASVSNSSLFNSSLTMPLCDIQDIDLQRWINITISVNGRIVDVYYDGKLARSAILPNLPIAPTEGLQSVIVGNGGGYGGKMSGIQFFPYPLTPDRIYAIYQAGPRGAAGFIGYLADKLGIRLTYSGAAGAQQSISV